MSDAPVTEAKTNPGPAVEVKTVEPSLDDRWSSPIPVGVGWQGAVNALVPVPPGRKVDVVIQFYPRDFQAGQPTERRLPVLGWLPTRPQDGSDWTFSALIPIGANVAPLWVLERAMSDKGERLQSITLWVDDRPLWRMERVGSTTPGASEPYLVNRYQEE